MSNPLLIPEIVAFVIDHVDMVPDLLSCACVNHIWNVTALKKLYKGSLNDMQFRTPDIRSLNYLFETSRERFAENMSFVKHLLLSTETVPSDEAQLSKITCNEECHALRHRKDAELLLRPQGRGLASLTIPFEIKGQEWSLISDLLLSPTVEYLAIDKYYCGVLMDSPSHSQELITPADNFLNLKALTVYKSNTDRDINQLCQLLERCDLQFFHLEESEDYIDGDLLSEADNAKVLSCLQQHQNLETLALLVPRCPPPLESTSPWPRLKALYLEVADPRWLKQLPKFDQLQILRVQNSSIDFHTIEQNAIKYITKCRHLRVIELGYLELDNVEALFDIADCCPLLQEFSVRELYLKVEHDLEDLLSDLVCDLTQLEILTLGLEFQMDGAMLQDICHYCERLAVVNLPQTQLNLPLAMMTNMDSLWQLEHMVFAGISFKDLQHPMQSDNIQSLETEWRRIFPSLRELPCPDDVCFGYKFDGDHASVSAGEETTPGGVELVFRDYKDEGDRLRTVLWKALGYGKDEGSHYQIQYLWQTDLETEVLGWPVVPLGVF